jgi:hypothetical protein
MGARLSGRWPSSSLVTHSWRFAALGGTSTKVRNDSLKPAGFASGQLPAGPVRDDHRPRVRHLRAGAVAAVHRAVEASASTARA